MKPDLFSVYLETTIISRLTSRPSADMIVESQKHLTRIWWNHHRQRYRVVVSDAVLLEISRGNAEASLRRIELAKEFEILPFVLQVSDLAASLHRFGGVPVKETADAVHIAYAAVYGIDFLMTWNCVHIANIHRRSVIARIIADAGFSVPTLVTPMEFLEHYSEGGQND